MPKGTERTIFSGKEQSVRRSPPLRAAVSTWTPPRKTVSTDGATGEARMSGRFAGSAAGRFSIRCISQKQKTAFPPRDIISDTLPAIRTSSARNREITRVLPIPSFLNSKQLPPDIYTHAVTSVQNEAPQGRRSAGFPNSKFNPRKHAARRPPPIRVKIRGS